MDERKVVIKHKVLNEKTGKVEIVEEVFDNNVTDKADYITRKWCYDRAKVSKVGDTFYTDLRDAGKDFYYEDGGKEVKILSIAGERVSIDRYVFTFVDTNEKVFDVVITL